MSSRLMERPTDIAFMEITMLLFVTMVPANGFYAPLWQKAMAPRE